MTGEPVCPVGGLQSYIVSLVYCCVKIENKTQLHVYCHITDLILTSGMSGYAHALNLQVTTMEYT